MQAQQTVQQTEKTQQKTMYRILIIISFAHLLNDTIQSLVPAMFPVLKSSLGLTFTQLGFILLALNLTASIIQPIVGFYTDKKPSPYALPIGLCFTLVGVLGLAFATSFWFLIISVALIGLGSATFHPEGSRVAYMAAGPRRGLAQSIYQVGGNTGQALAPLMIALIIVPFGQFGAIWFTFAAALAVILLIYIARWYASQPIHSKIKSTTRKIKKRSLKHRKRVLTAIVLLVFFVFARTWFHSGVAGFYSFYVIEQYGLSIQQAQLYLFIFLATGAIGTFAGGSLADRFGKKTVIMGSMLLSAPLTLLLPHVGRVAAYPLIALIGFIVLSSFAVAVVYAQELMPGHIGMVSGLVIGLGFGMGAVGSVVFGLLADTVGITNTILLIVLLPLIGIVAAFLPSDRWIEENIE